MEEPIVKQELRTLTGTLTGHCPVKYHLRNIGEATESAKHLLCECEAIHHQRLSHLGARLLDPKQVMDIAPRKVAKFMKTLLPDC